MRVFRITHDDAEERVVEAPDFTKAVEAWRSALIAEWIASKDWDGTDDAQEVIPRSVELIALEPVIRWESVGIRCARLLDKLEGLEEGST